MAAAFRKFGARMKRILVIHQSADLYGSDRTLLQLLRAMQPGEADVVVLLPCHGPLADELVAAGIEVHAVPLALITRKSLSLRGLLRLPVDLLKSFHAISKVLAGRKVDVVYSNTLAVISGVCWAFLKRTRHVWHIHEVPLHRWQRILMQLVFVRMGGVLVCNSHTTLRLWFGENVGRRKREQIKVVLNGVADPDIRWLMEADPLRHELGMPKVLISCVGRISWRKGQEILLRAAEQIWESGERGIHFLIVGSPPSGQEEVLQSLKEMMRLSPARDVLHFMDFQRNIWPVWAATDIAVVPSTEPESFGLVAVEAMAMNCAVIASGHGGIMEIVDHDLTGKLVAPGDVNELATSIRLLANDSDKRREMGEAGRRKFLTHFSEQVYLRSMKSILLATGQHG
jgi:glycosyltransferase involved in cell wall biosynthesis